MKIMGENALNMAGLEINDIRHLDLYSCFPSAVQIAEMNWESRKMINVT